MMFTKVGLRFVWIFLFLLGSAAGLVAQMSTGAINGVVADPSGAVVGGLRSR
jgi:hypothetical protein